MNEARLKELEKPVTEWPSESVVSISQELIKEIRCLQDILLDIINTPPGIKTNGKVAELVPYIKVHKEIIERIYRAVGE